MATVYVTMSAFGTRGATGDAAMVVNGPFRSETITSSGTTAAGNMAAGKGEVATINCATAVYVTNAATPTATATTGAYIPGGIPVSIAMNAGDKIAVIDPA